MATPKASQAHRKGAAVKAGSDKASQRQEARRPVCLPCPREWYVGPSYGNNARRRAGTPSHENYDGGRPVSPHSEWATRVVMTRLTIGNVAGEQPKARPWIVLMPADCFWVSANFPAGTHKLEREFRDDADEEPKLSASKGVRLRYRRSSPVTVSFRSKSLGEHVRDSTAAIALASTVLMARIPFFDFVVLQFYPVQKIHKRRMMTDLIGSKRKLQP